MALNLSSVGWKSQASSFVYDWKQLVLYALGIGAKAHELDYLYEGRGPKAFPTFAVVPATEHVFACLRQAEVPLASVVHGGQGVTVHGPLPAQGEVVTQGELAAIYDMKKFAQVVVRTSTALPDGSPLFDTVWSIIVRDAGGFGGAPPPKGEEASTPKDRAPDFRIPQKTSTEQALIYRLSGDTNPLHADPEVAHTAGFDRGPILHGLATFGFAARAVVAGACGGDAAKLTSIHGQFRKPVWPGETLVTEGWRQDTKLILRVSVEERSDRVLSNAWAIVRA
ncbi:MAG: MaoC family dehydratase N-terminal domain-containing protein [Polyangiaceae bacterium]|jgi:acyl dehydratase|nr:MaoC family dehydratase N-terminal domain-containing protein [Polyangiaceae bacterium]